ncbi:MAG: prephenate dehydrogenase [Treponema sp.]|nr:prephenate dehydrogenase [Treponema sp.]
MTDLRNLTYGVIGLGMMGGSIAQAIRQTVLGASDGNGHILACDKDSTTLTAAHACGLIDESYPPEQAGRLLATCDVVYVCLYPQATEHFITAHMAAFKPGAVITDISGVKAALVPAINRALRPDIDFVPGHPMAGGEKEGFVHADAAYFTGRNYLIMPQPYNRPESIALIRSLAAAMGFTHIVETDCVQHDHTIAFTSQLCHILAAALVASAEHEQVTEFGGGSFEDLTRIAMINAPLWTELFLANRAELLAHIDRFSETLATFRQTISDNDDARLKALLGQVRNRRSSMETYKQNG